MLKLANARKDAGAVWYVQAAGRIWGPYSRARLDGFIAEGRLTRQSLVANHVGGPFRAAGSAPDLISAFTSDVRSKTSRLLNTGKVVYIHSATGSGAPDDRANTGLTEDQAARPLLVIAELGQITKPQFEVLLSSFGEVALVCTGVWLVQARQAPAELRNALSRHLSGANTLLIVHAPLDQTAWFNIDTRAQHPLRGLWDRSEYEACAIS